MRSKKKRSVQKRCLRKAFPALFSMAFLILLMASFPIRVQAADQNSTSAVSAPPEFVDINVQKSCPDLKGLKKDVKSVKHFSHKAHIEALKKEGKGFICANCHQGAKTESDIINADRCKRLEKELNATGGPAKLKDHFHNQCLKCHKELKKAGKSTGPTSCKGCHNRKGAEK